MMKDVHKVEQPLKNVGIVSIILPIYNMERFLPNSLDSILQQTYPYWEAICVNDGSTDDTLKILQQYAARDSRFKIINKTNGGVASARNAGLDAATGAYISFLDPDDMFYPQFLDIMLKAIRQSDADMVWCKRKNCMENDGLEVCELYDNYEIVPGGYALTYFIKRQRPRLAISMFSKIFKAKILRNIRFNTSFRVMAEDFEFSLRAFELCGKSACVKRKLVIYRQNGSSLTHRPLSFEAVDDHINLMRFTVWHFKDSLDKRLRLKMWKRLMTVVFRYVCILPYYETENYPEFWHKYSAKCRQLFQEGTFFPQRLSLFQHLLCRLFLAQKWNMLRFLLSLYQKIRK